MGVLGGGQVDWSQAGLEEKISADKEKDKDKMGK